ncbi:MAG: class III extradiol ring-cleavage dioxygenase [Sphaerochaeta sp.]|nr:class III extradiol ring-cleavage dioxygenase [Sphaerochaeta sp.]
MQETKGQVIYFSHGGGPLPLLGDVSHRSMISFMQELPSTLHTPEAIVVISAHWEENIPTVLGAEHPSLLYDYYGFPKQAYEISYPAQGNPQLSKKIIEMLDHAGISGKIDEQRGFDHGLFVPLLMMYPKANIPAIQLSLVKGLDAQTHIQIGKALKDLLCENVLIIGSGFSFHNMQAFTWSESRKDDKENDAFQDWLIDVCTGLHSAEEREALLASWQQAPYARYCHPREEHLLPLHICASLAQCEASVIFDDHILGKRGIALKWL